MNQTHEILLIAVVAAVTLLLRALPFLVFRGKQKTPTLIDYLGRVLPFAVMGMLCVYCLKDVSILSYPFGLPEIIASAVVVLLHLWKRNTLVSILSGTLTYMALVGWVFV